MCRRHDVVNVVFVKAKGGGIGDLVHVSVQRGDGIVPLRVCDA